MIGAGGDATVVLDVQLPDGTMERRRTPACDVRMPARRRTAGVAATRLGDDRTSTIINNHTTAAAQAAVVPSDGSVTVACAAETTARGRSSSTSAWRARASGKRCASRSPSLASSEEAMVLDGVEAEDGMDGVRVKLRDTDVCAVERLRRGWLLCTARP